MPRRPGGTAIETVLLTVAAQTVERRAELPQVVPLHGLDFADLRRINIDLRDDFRLRCKLSGHAGDAVVEACTQCEQEIAIFHRIVGVGGTVHAQHVQRQRFGRVDGADAHQRRRDGEAESAGELTQCARRFRGDHAATGIQQWTLGLPQRGEEARAMLVTQRGIFQHVHALAIAGHRQRAFAGKRE